MAPVPPIFRTHPDDFTDSKEITLVRSATKDFVKKLTEIACQHHNCTNNEKRTTFSADNLPVMAYCGHYICASHENAPEKRDQFSMCHHCGSHNQVEEYLKDKVLNDFYKAIAQEGFKCMGCKERHPKHNTVYCNKYSPINKDDIPYLCVWCFTNEDYAILKFQSLDSAGQQGDIDENDKQLKSVDRTQDLAKKYEEATAANKRLQQQLMRSKTASVDRKMDEKTDEMWKEHVHNELELVASTYTAERSIDEMINQRKIISRILTAFNDRLKRLEDKSPQKRRTTVEGEEDNEAEKTRLLEEKRDCEEEIEKITATIQSLQSNVSEVNLASLVELRWSTVHTATAAKLALKHLFEEAATLMRTSVDEKIDVMEKVKDEYLTKLNSEKVEMEQSFDLLGLPDEMIEHIFSFLDVENGMRMRLNKRLNKIESKSKYYLEMVQLDERPTYNGDKCVTIKNRQYPLDFLVRIAQNSSIGDFHVCTSVELYSKFLDLIKEFKKITHFCLEMVDYTEKAIEMMTDSLFLDLTGRCKTLSLFLQPSMTCNNISFHQVYKNMNDGSTSLRGLIIDVHMDEEKLNSVLNLRGITCRSGRIISNRNIEAYKGEDEEDPYSEVFKVNIFDGLFYISFFCDLRESTTRSYSLFNIDLYENLESLNNIKELVLDDMEWIVVMRTYSE